MEDFIANAFRHVADAQPATAFDALEDALRRRADETTDDLAATVNVELRRNGAMPSSTATLDMPAKDTGPADNLAKVVRAVYASGETVITMPSERIALVRDAAGGTTLEKLPIH